MRSFDTAIIGAGPAGSAAAISLARKGYSVALIDKAPFPRPKLCGDFFNPANWPLCTELGVADEILAQVHEPISSFRITGPSGAQAMTDLSSDTAAGEFGLGLSRERLDWVLLRAARRRGALVYERLRIKHLVKNDPGWLLHTESDAGGETLRAKLLIGADGRNSWAANRLGLADRSRSRRESIGLQFSLGGVAQGRKRVEIHLFHGGYAGLVHLGDGTANLCMAVARDWAPRKSSVDIGALQRRAPNPFLRELLDGAELRGEVRSVSPVYFPPRRSYGDGLLLAGDAAQVVEPVTGEGIYFALASGLIAAETLAGALKRGTFSASHLGAYERLCRRELGRRRKVNRLIQFIVHRPSLGESMIRLLSRRHRLLKKMAHSICTGNPVGALSSA